LNQDGRDGRINQDLGGTRMEGIGGWTKIIIPLESCHPFQGFPIYTNNHPSAGSPLATGSFPWWKNGKNAVDLRDGIGIHPLSPHKKSPAKG